MGIAPIGACLSTWFLAGGAVWEGLGGNMLLGRALMFQKDSRHLSLAPSFLLAVRDVSSQLLLQLPAACYSVIVDSNPLRLQAPNKPFLLFICCLGHHMIS